ncbi:MAG TPA: hypothetical protein VI670_23965 [Thermoanaerobaculia bacterium]|jgi:sugar/nucleoside kinase (ribokinase family)
MLVDRITDRPINIFVIGDLVIDHAVFVVAKARYHTIDDEKVYEVRRRVNTAGGAANAARILGALNRGNTYLWGITGRSMWGTFSDVLEASEVRDVSAPKVILTGYHDDTVRMNTITRVIRVDGARHVHQARFDDVGSVGPSHLAAQSLMHQLHKVHHKDRLSAIILSDLDMSALDTTLVQEIAKFALENRVSLFVDPKRNYGKYAHISGTAILPNLYEWCELIGEPDNERKWRGEIQTHEGLKRFAYRSLQRFESFRYHIVKCDKDGAVVIGPARADPHRFSVVHLPAYEYSLDRATNNQLGSGDVLTAVTAMEFAASDAHDTDAIIRAVRYGSWIVSVYRHAPWGQMPTREDVAEIDKPIPQPLDEIAVSAGVRYLPSGDMIDLAEARTEVSQLLSVSERYKSLLRELLNKLESHWDIKPLRSVILTARGGSGKSEICAALKERLTPSDIRVLVAPDDLVKLNTGDKFIKRIETEHLSADGRPLLIVIDEAFARARKLLQHKPGVVLLDALHSRNIRLLMIDADFGAFRENLSESQFLTRCDLIELPPITDRPRDIPYIFLAGCLRAARREVIQQFVCQRRALVSVIDATLQGSALDQSPRTIFNLGYQSFEAALRSREVPVTVRAEHLPERYGVFAGDVDPGLLQVRYS